MKSLINSLVVAFSMYSKIPMPRADWNKENMRYSMCFFPWIGLVIGAIEYLWIWFCSRAGITALFAASVFTVIPILITGGIHMDGYLDTCDAMSSWREKSRRLEILKDSNAGAFAVIYGAVYFVLYLGAASVLAEWPKVSGLPGGFGISRAAGMMAAVFFVSRSLSAFSVVSFPHANPDGTAAKFGDEAQGRTVQITTVCYLIAAAIWCVMLNPPVGFCVIMAAMLSFLFYHHFSMKYFGGMTGDLAGFFTCICELSCLLVIAAAGAFYC